jgi:serine protease
MKNERVKTKAMVLAICAVFLVAMSGVSLATTDTNTQGNRSDIFEKKELNHAPSAVEYVLDEILVKFKPDAGEDTISRINSEYETSVKSTLISGTKVINVPSGTTVNDIVRIYERLPEVEYAEPNYIDHAFMVPNDPYYSYQWHLDNDAYGGINMESAWDISTGSGVVVAVLDTGVAYENYGIYCKAPDLAGTTFVQGYDFVNNDTHPNDDNGHGTHVTGTIAQTTNNNYGIAGVAFGCSIMPIKVLNADGAGTAEVFSNGVHYAVDHGADIISYSAGGPNISITREEAVEYAYTSGVTFVAAAGNEYLEGNPPQYPAAYDDYVIAVGATRYDETRSYYSNTGSYLDLTAPGGDMTVDQNADGYKDGVLQQTFNGTPCNFGFGFYQGTSMATPHVAGVAALLIANGVTGPDNIRNRLQSTAEDKGSPGWDEQYGWGLVDAEAALGGGVNQTTCNARTASTNVSTLSPTTNWQTVSGSLSSSSDTKRYVVNVTTTGTYEFSLCSADGGNDTYDSYLCLFGTAGEYLTSNDDACGYSAKITYNITSTGTYYIQVSGYSVFFGSYTLAYRRTTPPTPIIQVTSPNGGESWLIGSIHTISWTTSNVTGTVKIDLSRDAGSTWATIFSNTTNDGSESWNVTGPATTHARIKVVSLANPAISDISDADFTILDFAPLGLNTTCNARTASTNVSTLSPTTNWQTVSGSLSSSSDTKRYVVNVTTTGTYEFSLCSADGGSGTYDSYLCLFDAAGESLATNDDACGDYNAKITYNITSPGTYYIQVSGYSTYFGSYTLAYRKSISPGGIFDTDRGTYPSISGTHNGTVKPHYDINISQMYTYSCPGSGGHTEYVKIWKGSEVIAEKTWNGYTGDWHNISFNNSFTLYADETYNYTIRTGSYPQIIHQSPYNATGGIITCAEFIDMNGKRHEGWIPAIRLS